MRIGLQLPYFNFPDIRGNVAKIAKTAEDGGFYSMWVMDHFFQLDMDVLGPAEDPMLEGYSTLTYIAAITDRLKLGTLVTGVNYRHPGFLANAITTLDVLSGGRAYLGIGAGWYEREAKALGLPFPSTKERFEWLEETLQIVHQMWDEENNGAYGGTHFKLAETMNHPQPISQPHPPIMIGGMGEKKTLRFVAKYGDACNLFAFAGIDTLKHKLSVLQQHCEDVGRDYADIEKTTLGTAFHGDLTSAQQIVDFCGQLAEIGIQHAIFNMPDAAALTNLETMAEKVIPQVADL